ncbi:MerR family transcriptional regulator [Terrabacter aerolatus]|uniref:MerR family transcriptional regulator n=1 Tax=Terrabacter aerolatus TaxID=422442 RepID=UPI0027D93AFF|nr:MerR family transcriptional regulator [Terrabacter aerolatus]
MTVTAPVEGMTIAEAAERTGLTPHTLRYYERDGLMLRSVGRTTSGHRVYTDRDLTWVTMLTRLRATGMSIREVKAYAALCRQGAGNEAERLALLQTHRARVLAQLAEVHEHLEAIDVKIGMYASTMARADT